MADERVVAIDVGCRPEGAISGAILLQSERLALLTFNAMSNTPDNDGRYQPVGTAIVEVIGCRATRFGYPNDEGVDEHPLASRGLDHVGYAVCEVLNSTWAAEDAARAQASARRRFSSRFAEICQGHRWTRRHYIITFHDSTFECLADELQVRLSTDPLQTILNDLTGRLISG